MRATTTKKVNGATLEIMESPGRIWFRAGAKNRCFLSLENEKGETAFWLKAGEQIRIEECSGCSLEDARKLRVRAVRIRKY